jgi:hypothetical protein
LLGLNDSERADQQERWEERRKKIRAMALIHGISLRYAKMATNRNRNAWRETPARSEDGAKTAVRTLKP